MGESGSVEELAKKKGVSMAQIAIAWILTKDGQSRFPCTRSLTCGGQFLLVICICLCRRYRTDRGHDEPRQPQGHPRYVA